MKQLLYLIGEPGVGKTTVMRELVQDWPTLGAVERPQPARTLYGQDSRSIFAAQLGKERDAFGGTDALPLNVMPAVLCWIADTAYREKAGLGPLTIVAEGDRLASGKFFDAALRAGYTLHVVALVAPLSVTQDRRNRRGSHQSEAWLRGRRTKVQRLIGSHATRCLDATRTPASLAAELHQLIGV